MNTGQLTQRFQINGITQNRTPNQKQEYQKSDFDIDDSKEYKGT